MNLTKCWVRFAGIVRCVYKFSLIYVVDGTFCQAALKGKIQLKEQLPKYLGGTVQLGVCMLSTSVL